MGKITKEDIILLFLEDPLKLETEIFKENVPKSDEIRTLICELGNPWCAYWYAELIDKKPTDETRTVACKDPYEAYWYAKTVDKKPTDETREAAYKNPDYKEMYKKWENSLKNITIKKDCQVF